MALTTIELARAREATSLLLDELGLKAYLFEVDIADGQWLVKVDCALDGGGWQTVVLPAREIPLVITGDDAARRRLLASWRERLSACRI
ncbi:MAG: hypothetical protein RBT81_04560 [Gammaproteobacteria bacterium]|jgi:hypothetical protein|nr:hypothetical protein [Gammaproteobacteria bacterium]